MHLYFDHSSPPIISMTCDKYVWWNANRPYGHNLPLLCPTCASVRPWTKTTSEGPNSWNMQCSNPDCGLNADMSQFQPRAKLSGQKPVNATFMMPTSERQGFGDPWRVAGKGVHGYRWGLQSWNPLTLQLPTSTLVVVLCYSFVIDLYRVSYINNCTTANSTTC